MKYYRDQPFERGRQLIHFFFSDPLFRTADKFSANSAGRAGIIFRGQSDASWELIASAFRPNKLHGFAPQPPHEEMKKHSLRQYLGRHLQAEARAVYLFLEAADVMGIATPLDYTTTTDGLDLILAALKDDEAYNYEEIYPANSFQRATALAQHHGVPTRFLDWTESPFIASFFAAYGASSFSELEISENQEIAVIYLSTLSFSDKSSPIMLVQAPRHENTHLRQQQGVFTNIKNSSNYSGIPAQTLPPITRSGAAAVNPGKSG